MDDTQALKIADRWLHDARRRAEDIRARSANLVLEQRGFHRRGLWLIHAALLIGIPDALSDLRQKAVLQIANIQAELLEQGWEAMLDGRYAAAAHPVRLISELADYVPAAGVDEIIADRLLSDDKVRVSEARKLLLRNLDDLRSDKVAADKWVERRKGQLDAFNKLAHARAALLTGTGHLRGGTMHIGHDFDPVSLWAVATEYAQLAVNATVGVGVALGASLPDGKPWSDEQRRLLGDWRDFLNAGAGEPREVKEHKAEITRLRAALLAAQPGS